MKDRWKSRRKDIETRIARLRSRSERIGAHHARESQADLADPVDRAQLHDNDDVVGALGVHAEDELRALEAALTRLDEGSYGICVRCDSEIPEGRLDKLPSTPFCAKCAS